jgi:hypothetical protein
LQFVARKILFGMKNDSIFLNLKGLKEFSSEKKKYNLVSGKPERN